MSVDLFALLGWPWTARYGGSCISSNLKVLPLFLQIFFLASFPYSFYSSRIHGGMVWFMVSHRSLRISSFFFILFSSCSSKWVISIVLFSSCLMLSTPYTNMLKCRPICWVFQFSYCAFQLDDLGLVPFHNFYLFINIHILFRHCLHDFSSCPVSLRSLDMFNTDLTDETMSLTSNYNVWVSVKFSSCFFVCCCELNCILPKFIHWSPRSQKLSMWSYLELGSLHM